MRARVEQVFAIVERLWGFDKVRYRGFAKKGDPGLRDNGAGQHFPARWQLVA
ncbi:MAG: hypothetical protein HY855_17620 [Burkholderiales bacterium]|nr:hypothetical protein [Burkholderiales bacterium]